MSYPNPLQTSSNIPESALVDSSIARDVPTKVRDAIHSTIHYSTKVVEEVVKPSIKTFLETCDTNPQVAAIVATPALLAFLLAIAFLVISTLILVLWSLLTISVGVAFVVLGGLISLFFKLLVVFMATIPMAGIATGLLVGANAASQFIIKKLPGEGMGGITHALKEIDWAQILEGATTAGKSVAQWGRDATPILLMTRDALSTVGLAFHSAIHTAMAGLHHNANPENTSPNTQVEQPQAPSSSSTEETAEETSPHKLLEPIQHENIEPVDISDIFSQPEASARILKQRVPFTKAGGDETDGL